VNDHEENETLVSCLLQAKSVALVGASSGPGDPWTGSRRLTRRFLRAAGVQVALVNPGRERIYGAPGWSSLTAVPFGVDLAVLTVPASALAAAVEDAAAKKVGVCVVHTAHVPPPVKDLIRDLARASGMRFVGPNSAGFIDAHVGLDAMPGATGVDPPFGRRGALVVSQSGAFCTEAVLRLAAVGVPLRAAVSTGDELDVTAEEVLEAYLGAADELRCVLLFVETSRNPVKLVKVIRSALDAGVPVGVVKIGRTEASAAAAFSHTGALVGDWDCFAAAMNRDGATMCESVEELCDFAIVSVTGQVNAAQGRSVSIVSNSGGIAGLSADMVADCGLSLARLSDQTTQSLASRVQVPHAVWNPVDLGDVPGLTLEDYLETVQHDDGLDLIVVEVRGGIPYGPDAEVLRVMVRSLRKPVWACWPGIEPKACRDLIAAGVPVLQDTRRLWRLLDKATARTALAGLENGAEHRPWDGIPLRPDGQPARAMPYAHARMVAEQAGVAQPRFAVVQSDAELERAMNGSLTPPVAMKISSAAVTHKSDAGGVILHVRDIEQARAAYHRLIRTGGADAVVVEEMIPPGPELLLAARRTPFGVLLSIGWGGVYTEAVDDVASVMLPATDVELVRAMRSTRVWHAMRRHRDSKSMVEEARKVAEFMRRLGNYVRSAPEIHEIEANPVIASPDGLLAADVRIVGRALNDEE
jgi:acetate---CoA ligase (ADP-forming)